MVCVACVAGSPEHPAVTIIAKPAALTPIENLQLINVISLTYLFGSSAQPFSDRQNA
jgi:hypothetical protein